MRFMQTWWWIHPVHRPTMKVVGILLGSLVLLALAPAGFPLVFADAKAIATYLPAHALFETMSIIVSMLVFSVGWHAHRQILPGNIVLLAGVFFAVGWLDFFHTVSYTGMPDFITHNDWQKHLSYWLPARLLAALVLLVVAIRPWRPFVNTNARYYLMSAMILLVLLVNWAVLLHQERLPALFIPGGGLTPLKKEAEYLTIAINLCSAVIFWRKLARPQPFNAGLLLAAACVMGIGEFFFTLYTTMAGAYNVYGHIYKAISYLIIYRAIVVTAIEAPYQKFIESQANLARAVRASNMGLWDWDLVTSEVTLSAEMQQKLGVAQTVQPLAALIGLIHPDDRVRFQHQLNAIMAQFPQQTMVMDELRLRHQDGVYRWYLLNGEIRGNAQGQPAQMLGGVIDISERKQAEERFRCAFEAAPNAMLMVNEQGRIVLTNLQTSAMFGYTQAELLGQEIEILIPAPQRKQHQSEVQSFLAHARGRRMAADKELFGLSKTGRTIPVEVGLNPLTTSEGRFVIASVVDIEERKLAQQKIQQLVNFDALTGLPNRILLQDRMQQAISMADREHSGVAVLFIDLDHFKNINDTLGHRVGDLLLLAVSQRIRGALREQDTVSRMGGDEFVVLLPGEHSQGAMHVAQKLAQILSAPLKIEHHDLKITASIGIAMYPEDGVDFETLYQYSDTAMYRAKQEGRNSAFFFTQEMHEHALRMHRIENALLLALGKNQLALYYQPQLDIRSGAIVGVEALLRWQHPEMGAISPAEFIPIAEASGQIIEIGDWVLRTALRQLRSWQDAGLPPMTVAVNVSAVQFRLDDLPDRVMALLAEFDLPAERLELEITEGTTMSNPEKAIRQIAQLHSHGVAIAIDDFGTGYSSLSYLKRFQLDKLKIDQSFVRDIETESSIVSTIIQMADSLGFKTIAEGVETPAQLELLRSKGCQEVQGYLFSKPLPAEQLEAYVRHKQPLADQPQQ
ncbi:EAL domain-containing protein [Chitinibacter sp. S2-10]|uniref:bifunctional diguanylate cyclase/phosphodiesterase n=1 Tax=Chitinibacter sp. S2-10 TaxID=3373597 RepID=UPI003977A530